MSAPITFTHKGWFGLCPVYFANPESESPVIDPRWWCLGWLMMLSETLYGLMFAIRELLDPAFDPQWPLLITGELSTPIVRTP